MPYIKLRCTHAVENDEEHGYEVVGLTKIAINCLAGAI